jgi:Protein of unknown function (DUF2934)
MNSPASPGPACPPAPLAALQRTPSPYGPFDLIAPAGCVGAPPIARLLCGAEQRHEMIAQAAYFRARHRGFAPGHELEDWLAAEAEVDTELTLGLPPQPAAPL